MSLGLAIAAGINIGLVISIWAIGPFLAALLDLFCYKVPMKSFHIVGMIAMGICACLIALTGGPEAVAETTDTINTVKEAAKNLLPAYIPLLVAPIMPIVCTGQVAAQKEATRAGMSPLDFTFGSYLVFGVICQTIAFIYYAMNPGFFSWWYWLLGTLSSIFNLMGCLYATKSIATNAPICPIVALINCQSILCFVIAAI